MVVVNVSIAFASGSLRHRACFFRQGSLSVLMKPNVRPKSQYFMKRSNAMQCSRPDKIPLSSPILLIRFYKIIRILRRCAASKRRYFVKIKYTAARRLAACAPHNGMTQKTNQHCSAHRAELRHWPVATTNPGVQFPSRCPLRHIDGVLLYTDGSKTLKLQTPWEPPSSTRPPTPSPTSTPTAPV